MHSLFLSLPRSADRDAQAASRAQSQWGIAVVAFIAYYAGAKLGLALTTQPNPMSILWPPNAIVFAMLLIVPARRWWIVLAAITPAHFLAELQVGVPGPMVALWLVSNVSEALIGALCMRKLVPGPIAFAQLRDVLAFMFSAALASVLSSFLDSAFVTLVRFGPESYWHLWMTRTGSNMVASLTLVPAIVSCASRGSAVWRSWTSAQRGELAALATTLLAFTLLSFDSRALAVVSPALLYVPIPLLVWAALRFGPPVTSVLFAAFAFLVIWGAVHGLGPFSVQRSREHVFALQLFLVCVGPSLLSLAAVFEERQAAHRELQRSAERFSRAFQSSPTAMSLTRSKDGCIIDVNARWQDLFGYSAAEVEGRTAEELGLYPEADDRKQIARLSAGNAGVSQVEVRIHTRRDGVRKALLAVESASIDGEHCLVTSASDITERKHAEEALRQSDERFRLVLEATRDVVCERDAGGSTSWWSRNGLRQFGYERESIAEPEWASLIHPDDVARVDEQLSTAVASGARLWEADYRMRRADGTYADVHEHGFIARDDQGNAVRFVGALTDVTEARHRDELEQRLAHASRLTAMGELTASIAHEINQPISAILSNVDAAEILLERHPERTSELLEVLQDIRKDDLRVSEVIRHVRGLASKRPLEIENYDVNRLIGSVLRLIIPRAQQRKIVVRRNLADLPSASGDRTQIQQVLLNLLLNAMDAIDGTPGERREISVSTMRSPSGMIEVLVADTGRGIPEGQRDRIFESFYTTKKEGMGLGLSIARSLVEAHGGRIWVQPNSPAGSVFRFTIPVAAVREPAAEHEI